MSASLGDIVRKARKDKGWTQADLAQAVEMSQRWVSDIERGATSTPRLVHMRRLAEALDIPTLDLYVAATIAADQREARSLDERVGHRPADPKRRVVDLIIDADLSLTEIRALEAHVLSYVRSSPRATDPEVEQ